MRGGVDPARKSRGDDEPFEPQRACDRTGEFLTDGGAVARADNGDNGDLGKFEPAFYVDEGRGRIDLRERGG